MSRRSVSALVALCLGLSLLLISAADSRADNWLASVASAKVEVPPFRKEFYAGEVVKIKVLKDRALRFSIGKGSSRGTAAIIPIKDDKRMGRKRILEDDPLVFLDTPLESEYLALKVQTGVLNLDIDAVEMKEYRVTEEKKVELPVDPFKEIVGRFVNASDFRSVVTYTFMSGDDVISKTSARNRTITLEFSNSSAEKKWKSAADRMIVEAYRGDVVFKIGAPFPSED